MKHVQLSRSVGVTVTPFDEKGYPDYGEIQNQTEAFCTCPTEAILPCASTGEFVKLDLPERAEVLRSVMLANRGRKQLIAGTCDISAMRVIRSIEAAKRYDYDACVVCPPFYYGLTQEAVLDFYREVCAAAEGMPIVAYHVPFFTTGIEIPTFLKLMEIPNLVGMKDSSAVMKRIAHLCDLAKRERPEFVLYTGTDDCLLPALTAGCHGNMTALSASMPWHIDAIYQAFDKGDLQAAMAAQRAILPILRECDSLPFPIGYKLLAKAQGMRVEDPTAEKEIAVYKRIQAMLKVGV
ncbi:MAG: dihydrodipicolinate synthase family protein [Clostridia bacterium]|nr:dihydrodipicolinate synthase family protein [Clostridia bacterium]